MLMKKILFCNMNFTCENFNNVITDSLFTILSFLIFNDRYKNQIHFVKFFKSLSELLYDYLGVFGFHTCHFPRVKSHAIAQIYVTLYLSGLAHLTRPTLEMSCSLMQFRPQSFTISARASSDHKFR